MSVRDNYHGRFTDMTRSLCQGKKFRIAPVPHVITGRIGPLVGSENSGSAATVQTHSTTLGQDKSDHSNDSQKLISTKISSFRNQDKKKHSSTKEGSAIIQSSQKVTAAHTKSNKVSTNLHPSSNVSLSTKENKVGRAAKEKSPHEKETKDTKHTKSSKHSEKESKQAGLKRQLSPSHAQHGSDRKRKRTTSTSSESNSTPQPTMGAEKKADIPKSKHKEAKAKEKHKSKPASTVDNDNSVSNSRKERSKEKSKITPKPAKKLSAENNVTSPLYQGNQKTSETRNDGNGTHAIQPEEKVDISVVEHKEDSVTQADDLNSSPSSSISLSSLPPGGSHGPLATMMAEMEKDLLSPLSSEPGSHSLSNSPVLKVKTEDNHTSNCDLNVSQSTLIECTSKVIKDVSEEDSDGKMKDDQENINKDKKDDVEQGTKIKKDQTVSMKKKRDEVDGKVRENIVSKTSFKKGKLPADDKTTDKDKKKSQSDQVYVNELLDLQQKIMSLNDRHILQKIANMIEETGHYDITNSSFDFDLCRLDLMTVRKLQSYLAVK